MSKIYLAINYGPCEGWKLYECSTLEEALSSVRHGGTFGCEWKILKELEIKITDE